MGCSGEYLLAQLYLKGLGLDDSEELSLLFGSLETSVSHLGGGIDKLEVDLLGGVSRHLREERLSKSNDTLLGSHDATSNHDPVLVDLTIMGETTHGRDRLLSQIVLGHSVVWVFTNSLTHSVNLLIDLSSVIETILTSSSDGIADTGWMPRTNACNLSLSSMGLSGQDGNSPSLNDTSVSVSLSDTNDINHFILSKDSRNWDLLLEKLGAEINLVRDGSTVDLNLNNVCLLLTELDLGDLSVHYCADHLTVLLSSGDLGSHLVVISISLGVLGEGLLLRVVP